MKKNKKMLVLTLSLISGSVGSLISASSANNTTETKTALTNETAQKIYDGTITMYGGYYDSLLFKTSVMDPEADDDSDGIKNKDEVYIFYENGKQYYGLYSHPKLVDTDGDGIKDNEDSHKLKWDLSNRDMMFFQELAYRKKQVLFKMFDDDAFLDFKDNVQETLNLEKQGKYAGNDNLYVRNAYVNMQYEMSRYWQPVYTWDESNGYQAVWFTNQSDFPFIESQTNNVLAIAGTNGGSDYTDDLRLWAGRLPRQVDNLREAIWYWQSWDKRNKFFNTSNTNFNSNKIKWLNQTDLVPLATTGHSLGGYLSNAFGALLLESEVAKEHKGKTSGYNGAWSFNAPKIKDYWLGKYTEINIGNNLSHNYVTAGDPMKTFVGHFSNAITVGDGGHGSTLFFKKPIVDKYFTKGIRTGSETISNPQPLLMDLALSKTIFNVNYVRTQTNKNIASYQWIFTNKERYKKKINDNLPKGYRYTNSNYLSTVTLNSQNIEIEPIPHTITYKFKFNNKILSTETIKVNVETESYNLPKLPPYPNTVLKRYALKNLSELPYQNDFTKDTTYEIELKEEENKRTTTINFVDKETNEPIGHTFSVTTYPSETINYDNAWNNSDYKIATEPEQNITWGKENTIKLELIPYTQKVIFMYNNQQVGEVQFTTKLSDSLPSYSLPETGEKYQLYKQESIDQGVREGNTITYKVKLIKTTQPKKDVTVKLLDPVTRDILSTQTFKKWDDEKITQSEINLPTHYEFANVTTYEPLETQDIVLKRKNYTLTYNFKFNNQIIDTKEIVVEYKGDYTLPQLPISNNEDYEYAVSSPLQKITNIEKNQIIDINLVKNQQTTTINFMFNNSKVSSMKLIKSPKYTIKPSDIIVPQNYVLKNQDSLNSIIKGQENSIELLKTKKTINVSFKYNNELVSSQSVIKDFDASYKASSLDIPNGYYLTNPDQILNMDHDYELNVQKNTYTLTYSFILNNAVLASQTVSVKYHEDYVLPTLPVSNSDEFEYRPINDYHKIPNVENNQTISVELEKAQTITTINYIDNNNIINTQTIAKSPKYTVKQSDLILPLGYEFSSSNIRIETGKVNNVSLLQKTYTLTYSFVFDNQTVSNTKVQVVYHGDYKLPIVPLSNSDDFEYGVKNQYNKIENVEADQTVVVSLVKLQKTTTINYLNDANSIIKTQKITKSPTYKVKVTDLELPNNYALNDPNVEIQTSQINNLRVTEDISTTTFKFYFENTLLDTITLKQATGTKIKFSSLNIPTGYVAKDNQAEYNSGGEYSINLSKQQLQIVYEYIFNNSIVDTKTIDVTYGESYNVPDLPISNSNLYDYELVDKSSYVGKQNVHQNETIAIYLKKKQTRTTINYYYQDKLVSTQDFLASDNYNPVVSDLILPANYQLEDNQITLNKGQINNVNVILVDTEHEESQTLFVFEYDNQIIHQQSFENRNNEPISVNELEVPNGYEISEPQPEYALNQVHKIILVKKKYSITYEFIYDGQVIDFTTILVPFNESYELPSLPISDDFVYSPVGEYTPISHVQNNEVIKIELSRTEKEKPTLSSIITFIDVNSKTILKTQTISKKANEKLLISDLSLPSGYKLVNSDLELVIGNNYEIEVQKEQKSTKNTLAIILSSLAGGALILGSIAWIIFAKFKHFKKK